MLTAIRPADARHQIAILRQAKADAYESHLYGRIDWEQAEAAIDGIDRQLAEIRVLAGWMS